MQTIYMVARPSANKTKRINYNADKFICRSDSSGFTTIDISNDKEVNQKLSWVKEHILRIGIQVISDPIDVPGYSILFFDNYAAAKAMKVILMRKFVNNTIEELDLMKSDFLKKIEKKFPSSIIKKTIEENPEMFI